MSGDTIVVMAAGLGTRYRGTKQFEAVGPSGEALVEYALFDARRAGFGRAVFVIRDELTRDFERLVRSLPSDLPAASVVQDVDALPAGFAPPAGRVRPWGTVHAVLAARSAVRGAFAVINGDDFYGPAAYEIAMRDCRADGGEASVIGMRIDRTLTPHGPVTRAVCDVDEQGRLRHLEEVLDVQRRGDGLAGRTSDGRPRRLTGRELASMNFWVFPDTIFDPLEEQFVSFLRRWGSELDSELALPDAVGALVARGETRVQARQVAGPWFGLTHEQDREGVVGSLRKLVERGAYPSPLWGRR